MKASKTIKYRIQIGLHKVVSVLEVLARNPWWWKYRRVVEGGEVDRGGDAGVAMKHVWNCWMVTRMRRTIGRLGGRCLWSCFTSTQPENLNIPVRKCSMFIKRS